MKIGSSFTLALLSTLFRSIGPVAHSYLMFFSPWELIASIEAIILTAFYAKSTSGRKFIPQGIPGWLMALLNVAATIFFFLSLRMVGPMEVTLWLRNQSLLTTILAIIFLGERHSLKMWLAIGFSLLGAFVFSYYDNAGIPAFYNIILLFLFCITIAVRNLLIKMYPNYNDKEIMLQGSWLQLVFLIWFIPAIPSISLSQIAYIVGISILCQGWSMTLFIRAVRVGTLSQVTAVRASGPIFTFLLSWVVFSQEWTLGKVVGIILSFLSIIIMFFIEKQKSSRENKPQTINQPTNASEFLYVPNLNSFQFYQKINANKEFK